MNIGWVFDPAPPSGSISGGSAAQFSFVSRIDTLVRESIQNSMDARMQGELTARIVFRLIKLTGQSLDHFKEAVHWSGTDGALLDNLESVSPDSPAGVLIHRGLQEIDTEQELSLLVIEDYGTKGLNGEELHDTKGGFGSLVKHTLVSAKRDESSGGSFGLGSSVLWSFSSIQTVLFHSILSEPTEGQQPNRFMGSAKLPTHKTEEDGWCDGPGYLGIMREPCTNQRRAESVWGQDAKTTARHLQCERADGETGLSAVIVGLAEPGFDSRIHDEILHAIKQATLSSFWPALADGRLEVEVRTEVNGTAGYSVNIADDMSKDPWKHLASMMQYWRSGEARRWPHEEGDTDSNKYDLKLTDVAIEVPRRIVAPRHPQEEGKVPLLISILPDPATDEDEYEEIRNRIFKFRGPGMIVRADQKSNISVSAKPFVAIVPCGEAAGSHELALHVEHYLRSAEPPAHDKWEEGTQLLNAHYKKLGIRAKLKRFQANILERIREVISVQPTRGGELPPEMRKLLSFGGSGGGIPERYMELSGNGVEASNEGWLLNCSLKRRNPTELPWEASVQLVYAGESGNSEMRGFSEVECVGEPRVRLIHKADDRAFASFEVPADIQQVSFIGSVDGESLPSVGMRGRAKLVVRGKDMENNRGGNNED